jgi:predicted nucleotidyltransferase
MIPKKGIQMPKSGTPSTSVADALFGATQQRVLALLFGQPRRAYLQKEVIDLAGAGSGAVQRELSRLVASGLVSVREAAGRKLYQANASAPVFRELRAIVAKTSGIADAVRNALAPHADRIALALLYGSVAKGRATASSDVDVLLVSDELTLEEALAWLAPVERRVGLAVRPTLYTRDEFARRRRAGNPFVTKVLAGEHRVLVGSLDEAAR